MEHTPVNPDLSAVPSASAAVEDAAALRQRLDAMEALAQERLAGWQRAQADYENLRKRTAQDIRDRSLELTTHLLLELLEITDDFDRALAADHTTDPDAWVRGVRMIRHKIDTHLQGTGLAAIPAAGVPFDPRSHDAVGQAPGPAGQIIAEVRRGFRLGDRVVRPSSVIVGSGEPPAAAPQ